MKAKVINDLTYIDSELMDALDRDDMQSVAHLALDVIPRMVEEYQPAPQKQSVTIEGTMSRGLGRELYLRVFPKSERGTELPKELFPELNYLDEPTKVKITIEEI